MHNLWNVYRRECSSYFTSPVAYIVIMAFLVVMSFLYFVFLRFFSQETPDFRPFFEHLFAFGFFSFVVIPAITMRLWSEEKKQGTVELLLTLPMRSWQVVLGKFFASYTVIVLAILLTVFVPISLSFVVDGMDWQAIVAMYIGLILMSGIYISLGCLISSLTENQVVAFVLTAVCAAILCFLGYPGVMNWINSIADQLGTFRLGTFLGNLGTFSHYQSFAKGLLSLVDVLYSLTMIALFVLLNNVAVEARKY